MLRRAILRLTGLSALALSPVSADRAAEVAAPPLVDPLVLESVTILDSRIRRREGEGLSPVGVFDREFIAASGALRVADFLNLLPQNYTGGSSGRGSAPNEFNPEFGVRTESLSPSFDFVLGAASVPLAQSGVSGANLRGLGSGSTLVLVDGRRLPIAGQGNRGTDTRQGFVDLNAIPLGMVERIEVLADGASALYGSDAIGGVINVVLKKNYAGAELATDYRGAFAGGARERRATLTAGLTTLGRRLRGTVMLERYDRAKLTAAQRDFSQGQDHRDRIVGYDALNRPIRGRDLRLNWGYPAVVQARTGPLNGVTSPGGAPVSVALVPEGARTTPPPAQFTPGQIVPPNTTLFAVGQRRSSTAAFLALVPPQESRSAATSFDTDLGGGLRASARFSASDVRGRFDGQPPVSIATASTGFGNFSTLVPAVIGGQPNSLNPFGQDVLVGLVHAEFGATRQTTATRTRSAGAGLAGRLSAAWSWETSADWSRQGFAQDTLTLDQARFTSALAATDPALRFNPFIDARAGGATNAALYPAMTRTDRYEGTSELTVATFLAGGPLGSWQGREVRAAVGGDYEHARHRAVTRPATGVSTDLRAVKRTHALFAELSAPLFGGAHPRPGLHRLELQLAGRYEQQGRAGQSVDPKVGIAWAPVRPLVLRASHSTGFRAPSLTETETLVTTGRGEVIDPRRTPQETVDVAFTRGSRTNARPERSRHDVWGLGWAPPFVPGLSLDFNYVRTIQRDTLQSLDPSQIVLHEAAFPGRVTRTAPTPADAALNQPGAITAVDATFVNFGEVHNESLDLRLAWELPWRQAGRVRLSLDATHTLVARSTLLPGDPPLTLIGDTGAPPRWRGIGSVMWTRARWHTALFVTRVGAFATNRAGNVLAPHSIPAWSKVNISAGYTFRPRAWLGRTRELKVIAGIGNLFDRAPPFADTVFGFNGGLHDPLGRTYSFSLVVPY